MPGLVKRVLRVPQGPDPFSLGRSGPTLGLFGASTGAAAAILAAARLGARVGAVVSRGGRPDLASDALDQIRAAMIAVRPGIDHSRIASSQADDKISSIIVLSSAVRKRASCQTVPLHRQCHK